MLSYYFFFDNKINQEMKGGTMNILSSDLKETVKCQGKYYQIYYTSEAKRGRGKCSICGKNKRYWVVDKVIGIEEYNGTQEIDPKLALGKEIVEKLKRVVRRENFCNHCDM